MKLRRTNLHLDPLRYLPLSFKLPRHNVGPKDISGLKVSTDGPYPRHNLTDRYMSGPKADAILQHAGVEKKKRKRPKNEDYVGGSSKGNGGGLVLQDEDEKWRSKKDGIELDGEDAPGEYARGRHSDHVVIGKEAATFKKGASAWATVGASALPLPAKVKEEPKEDVPAEAGPSEPPKQLTKMKGGLRPAKQIREEAERAAVADKSPSPPPEQDVTQTVHRDQSGRVIDVNDLKAKAIQAEMDEKAKAEERKQWTKGLVQREETERRLQREAAMSRVDVAR